MATCPACDLEMETTALVCRHCGHDIPLSIYRRRAGTKKFKPGLASLSWAHLALLVCKAFYVLCCIAAFIYSALFIYHGELRYSTGFIALAFVVALGQLILSKD